MTEIKIKGKVFIREDIEINSSNFFDHTIAIWTECVVEDIDRSPDFVSYSKPFVIWQDDMIDYTSPDEDGIIHSIEWVNGSYIEGESLMIIENITGKRGDNGWLVEYTEPKVSSKYWYTPDGVYRESDHWGRIAGCEWHTNGKKYYEGLAFCKFENFKKTFCARS